MLRVRAEAAINYALRHPATAECEVRLGSIVGGDFEAHVNEWRFYTLFEALVERADASVADTHVSRVSVDSDGLRRHYTDAHRLVRVERKRVVDAYRYNVALTRERRAWYDARIDVAHECALAPPYPECALPLLYEQRRERRSIVLDVAPHWRIDFTRSTGALARACRVELELVVADANAALPRVASSAAAATELFVALTCLATALGASEREFLLRTSRARLRAASPAIDEHAAEHAAAAAQ